MYAIKHDTLPEPTELIETQLAVRVKRRAKRFGVGDSNIWVSKLRPGTLAGVWTSLEAVCVLRRAVDPGCGCLPHDLGDSEHRDRRREALLDAAH